LVSWAKIESSSFALYGKRQTPGKEKFYGIRQQRVNELAVLKLQCIIILLTQERKYETKTFNDNFAKKIGTCRLAFPENAKQLKLPITIRT
jgi:hypothetical protein